MSQNASTSPTLPRRFSLVAQTVDSLCEGIQNGHWHGLLPGERELCETLQVSRRTLRSALVELQRKGWVEVEERQRRRIKRRAARPAEVAQKKVLAILAPSSFLSMPQRLSFVMETLRTKLAGAGFEVQFHHQPGCYTANPGRTLAQFVGEHPAAVWLVLSAQVPMQRWLARQPFASVILGSCAPGLELPSVDVDFHAACHHAGGMLWRKGHRRVALVLHKGIYGGDIASEEGLREALKDRPGAHCQVVRHDGTGPSLCAAVEEVLRSPAAPTALLVGGALHSLTLVTHLLRKGRRIPQDVAVVSRDSDPVLDSAAPWVARYAIQPAQLAARMALVIRQLAETGTVPEHAVRLIPSYIPGDSV